MMNEKYNAPNSPCCGRPMHYAPANCGCNYEPECPVPACIRKKKPDCEHTAVIPAITVESTDDLINYRDTLIHVMNNNTTYYVDDKGRPMLVWAGPVEYNNYDLDANPLKLRNQILLDIQNNRGAYYDRSGQYKTFLIGDTSNLVNYAKITLTYVEGEDNLWSWQVEGAEGLGLTDFERLRTVLGLGSNSQHYFTEIIIDGAYVYRGNASDLIYQALDSVQFNVFSPDTSSTDLFCLSNDGYAVVIPPTPPN